MGMRRYRSPIELSVFIGRNGFSYNDLEAVDALRSRYAMRPRRYESAFEQSRNGEGYWMCHCCKPSNRSRDAESPMPHTRG